MFETFFFFLTAVAVILLAVSFIKASNPLLALAGIILIVTSLFVTASGIETSRVENVTTTDIDANTIDADFNYANYMPLVTVYPEIWVISQMYLYGGILCLLFVFANFGYKRWQKRLIDRGV